MSTWAFVEVEWVPTDEGGRRVKPTGDTYFGMAKHGTECWSLVLDLKSQPNRMRFIADGLTKHLLVPGTKVDLLEGFRTVGTATVLSIRS